MTDQNNAQQSVWLRLINSQRFKMFLMSAVSGSGFLSLKIVKAYFPDLNVSEISGDIVVGIPFVANVIVEWYRNHPDNILARARKVINGGTASSAAVAATANTAEAAKQ